MGAEEQIRRGQLLERMKRLLDTHSKTWTIEEEPGVLHFVYDPAAGLVDEPAPAAD